MTSTLKSALEIVNREMLKTSERLLELTVLKMALEKQVRGGVNDEQTSPP